MSCEVFSTKQYNQSIYHNKLSPKFFNYFIISYCVILNLKMYTFASWADLTNHDSHKNAAYCWIWTTIEKASGQSVMFAVSVHWTEFDFQKLMSTGWTGEEWWVNDDLSHPYIVWISLWQINQSCHKMGHKCFLIWGDWPITPYTGWLAIMWPSERVTWSPITPYKDIIIHTIEGAIDHL